MSELRFVRLGFEAEPESGSGDGSGGGGTGSGGTGGTGVPGGSDAPRTPGEFASYVDYEEAWAEQRRLHAARFADEIPDTCLLLQHPPVYTAGRRTAPAERPLDGTPVIDVDRGGRITWHGPGQLVGYPIVKLPRPVDVVAHVRRLEEALIRTCAEFGLVTSRVEGRSGVWVLGDARDANDAAGARGGLSLDLDPRLHDDEFDPRLSGPEYAPSNAGQRGEDRKVVAIGIRVAKGVTMHGFALNVNPDNTWFDRIVPCGIRDAGVTSLAAELGRDITVADVLPVVERHLRDVLENADPKPRVIERPAQPVPDGAAAPAGRAGSAKAGSAGKAGRAAA